TSKFSDELSTTFLELESSSSTPFSTEHSEDELIASEQRDHIDESWAASILDDLDEPESTQGTPPGKQGNTQTNTPEIRQQGIESHSADSVADFSFDDLAIKSD